MKNRAFHITQGIDTIELLFTLEKDHAGICQHFLFYQSCVIWGDIKSIVPHIMASLLNCPVAKIKRYRQLLVEHNLIVCKIRKSKTHGHLVKLEIVDHSLVHTPRACAQRYLFPPPPPLTPLKGVGEEGEGIVENKKQNKSNKPINKQDPLYPYYEFAKWFHNQQKLNMPNLTKSINENTNIKGTHELDKMVRLDDFDFEKLIKPALIWTIDDPFWSINVRSLANLRKKGRNGCTKFENILASYEKDDHHKQDTTNPKKKPFKNKQKNKLFFEIVQTYIILSGTQPNDKDRKQAICLADFLFHYYQELPGDPLARGMAGGIKAHYVNNLSFCKKYMDFLMKCCRHMGITALSSFHYDKKFWSSFIKEQRNRTGWDLPYNLKGF